MLDNETMTLLTKLKVAAKKCGTNVDLIQMSGDPSYAAATLTELSNVDDADIVGLALSLMNKFGLISAPKPAKDEEEDKKDRYIGGLR